MKIVLISSSIRIQRNSHRVALLLQQKINGTGKFESNIIDLKEESIPLFQERYIDMADPPPNLKAISEELKSADGIIFITPEYNGSISAALKSLIDIYGSAEFADKPIGVAAVSTGALGGIRAALSLQQIILGINAYPFPRMLLTGEVTKQVDEMGKIVIPGIEVKIEGFLTPFLGFVEKLKKIDQFIYEEFKT